MFRPIDALNVLCVQLTRDLFAIAKFLSYCRAMLCISAAYAAIRCLSVCQCVCHVRELCQN